MTAGEKSASIIVSRLAVHLGPNVARVAVKSFSQRALGIPPEETTPSQIPKLVEALRPMLNVMLGKDHAEVVVGEIWRDLGHAA